MITNFLVVKNLLCLFGKHNYTKTPVFATLGTFWMQGGDQCGRCGFSKISVYEAGWQAEYAYERGKRAREIQFYGHCNGLKDLVRLYGINGVRTKLDELENSK